MLNIRKTNKKVMSISVGLVIKNNILIYNLAYTPSAKQQKPNKTIQLNVTSFL